MLQHYRSTEIVHLITHIPFGNIHKYLKYIFSISMNLPENYVLLLENEKTDSNNYKYLMQIDELCALLCKQEITNVGICLDIGHLLFGAYKEGIIQGHCLEQLTKMSCTLSMIKQIHIHDYLGTDHLQLGEGIMSLENVSRFIVENGLMVPIIIEATVKQPEHDGVKQIFIMSQALKNIEEMMK